ncbi:SpnB-like Rossmann fold domain-containing protein, partial [Pseudofrankia asymbiotica]|uniref:SpnB-like Rossmann fold domain-containing protein n=1 Tax=Pseudofrankia asymbiotica TaxID=1834516 RepID=UPI0018E9808E
HTLHTHHTTHYLELTPHPTLTPPTLETLHTLRDADEATDRAARHPGFHVTPLTSPHHPESRGLAAALATLWAHGHRGTPTGDAAPRSGARRRTDAELPAYPFQNRRYWLDAPASPGDLTAVGLTAAGHPFLSTSLVRPDGAVVLTGRVSLAEQPWLADHALDATTLLPAAAFLDLALHAAHRTQATRLDTLTVEAPLVLADSGAVHLQLAVGAPGADGRRTLEIHSRPAATGGDADTDAAWTRHVSGLLTHEPASPSAAPAAAPPGGDAVDLSGFYDRLAEQGYRYGPAFQGLGSARRHGAALDGRAGTAPDGDLGGILGGEVRLGPDGTDGTVGTVGFGIHPALLDAALHLVHLDQDGAGAERDPDRLRLPFAWSGVTLHATGAAAARAQLTRTGAESYALALTDAAGAPVLTADELVVRAASRRQLAEAAAPQAPLYELTWQVTPADRAAEPERATVVVLGSARSRVVEALASAGWASDVRPDLPALLATVEDGTAAPELVVADLSPTGSALPGSDAEAGDDADAPAAAHAMTARVLALLRDWLAEPRLDGARLVLVSQGTVATDDGDPVPALTAAPVWGLVRTAQAEHPHRFGLVDLDDDPLSLAALPSALGRTAEPQLALRHGARLAARLTAHSPGTDTDTTDQPALDPDGTVLITGGTGTLGGLVARHLVTRHGARHL